MPSVAEITYFKASPDYQSGKFNLNETLAKISKVPGLKKSYVGDETEDPTMVFWVNDWDTKDAHDAFAKQADYTATRDACRPAFGSEPKISYIEFDDTKGTLGAPITEFVTFALKEGKNIDQLEPLVQELHRLLGLGIPKFHGDSWAPIIDKPNVYHGILGWDTVKAHWDAVSDGTPLKKVIDQVKEIADLWLVHAALKPYSA